MIVFLKIQCSIPQTLLGMGTWLCTIKVELGAIPYLAGLNWINNGRLFSDVVNQQVHVVVLQGGQYLDYHGRQLVASGLRMIGSEQPSTNICLIIIIIILLCSTNINSRHRIKVNNNNN